MTSTLNQAQRDKQIYDLAWEYLEQVVGVSREEISRHLTPPPHPTSLNNIFLHLLTSAQSSGQMHNIIGGSIDGVEHLGKVLHDFDPKAVTQKYTSWQELFEDIKSELKPRGKLREEPNSSWPKFCRSIMTGGHFLSQFDTSDDFYAWVDSFYSDDSTYLVPPRKLAEQITGFGLALAMNFLKELGYERYAKPDTHLIAICTGLNLAQPDSTDAVFDAITRIAAHAGVTPYNVDMLFWLIGSGDFYLSGRKVGRQRDGFIDYVKKRLKGIMA
jgi:hypothetical protein